MHLPDAEEGTDRLKKKKKNAAAGASQLAVVGIDRAAAPKVLLPGPAIIQMEETTVTPPCRLALARNRRFVTEDGQRPPPPPPPPTGRPKINPAGWKRKKSDPIHRVRLDRIDGHPTPPPWRDWPSSSSVKGHRSRTLKKIFLLSCRRIFCGGPAPPPPPGRRRNPKIIGRRGANCAERARAAPSRGHASIDQLLLLAGHDKVGQQHHHHHQTTKCCPAGPVASQWPLDSIDPPLRDG